MDHIDANLPEQPQAPSTNIQKPELLPKQIATSLTHHEAIVRIENLYLDHLRQLGEAVTTGKEPSLSVSHLIPVMYPKPSTPEERIQQETLVHSFLDRFDPETQKEILLETDKLVTEIRDFRDNIARKFSPEVSQGIFDKYQDADKETGSETDKDVRIKERLAKFEGIQIVSDFDGTMSTEPKEYLDRLIPGNALVDPFLDQYGREILPLMHVLAWQKALREDPEYFMEGGKRTPLREGVNEFLRFAKEKQIPITVVSTGFMPFLEGAMTQLPDSDQVKLIGVSAESIVSSDKGTVIADLAQANPEKATIFIGDGSTDRPALDARDMIACYFALEGSGFAKQLEAFNQQAKEKGEPEVIYYTYTDFTNILQKIKNLSSPNTTTEK